MSGWAAETLEEIATADDLHVAPERPNGRTGTPTWIWSVAVGGVLYVRPDRGEESSWWQSAQETHAGIITSGGSTYGVTFAPVDGDSVVAHVDDAYATKYADSAYLPAMVAAGPRGCTRAVTPV